MHTHTDSHTRRGNDGSKKAKMNCCLEEKTFIEKIFYCSIVVGRVYKIDSYYPVLLGNSYIFQL